MRTYPYLTKKSSLINQIIWCSLECSFADLFYTKGTGLEVKEGRCGAKLTFLMTKFSIRGVVGTKSGPSHYVNLIRAQVSH